MSIFFDLLEKTRIKSQQIEALSAYLKSNPNAEVLKSDTCVRCGCCCFQKPGNLDKNDVAVLSKHFKLTKKELFKRYLVIDKINQHWSVIPRRAHQSGGRYLPWKETYEMKTSCVFFKDKACEIHDKKPVMCRETFCNSGNNEKFDYPPWTKKELMKTFGWDGVEDDE